MSKQPKETEERLEEGDKVKFRPFGHPITVNEIHAVQLGVVGLFAGLAYSTGMEKEALGASALLIGMAFGVRGLPNDQKDGKLPIAFETKRHEPWWFTMSYTTFFFISVTAGSLV